MIVCIAPTWNSPHFEQRAFLFILQFLYVWSCLQTDRENLHVEPGARAVMARLKGADRLWIHLLMGLRKVPTQPAKLVGSSCLWEKPK